MTYSQARDQEQLRLMQTDIDRFVANYDAGSPTIVFLPGGMAASLSQATVAYSSTHQPPYTYDLDWVGLRTLFGGVPALSMHGTKDTDGHVTVASGIVGICDITPYLGLTLWCLGRPHPFNFLVVPWDWRRRPEDTVTFLTGTLLPLLRSRIQTSQGADFRAAGYNLVSHSFGGLVLKMVLDQGGPWVDAIGRAISVAAPFYGYGGSQHFYFAGFSYLASFYSKRELAEVIGSLRGPYVLMYLDAATYALVGAQLAADPAYPLAAYPSVDATHPAQTVDPYHPGAGRYPDGGWVDMTELAHAAITREHIAKPLPPAVREKFFNIRGVQTAAGQASQNTFWSQTWATVPPGFDPDTDVDPITSILGAGDDTIPAWSARLVDTPAENVITITDLVEHMTLMDNPAVLTAMERLVDGPTADAVTFVRVTDTFRRTWNPEETATAQQLQAVLRRLRATAIERGNDEFLKDLPIAERQRLARRFIKDLAKAPPGVPTRHQPGRSGKERR